MNHHSLRVMLHGCCDGYEGQPVGIPFQDLIAGAKTEIRFAAGHLLSDAAVLGERKDGYVQAFGLVVAEQLRGIETAVFRLGIPIELQADRREAVHLRGPGGPAASNDECVAAGKEQCRNEYAGQHRRDNFSRASEIHVHTDILKMEVVY